MPRKERDEIEMTGSASQSEENDPIASIVSREKLGDDVRRGRGRVFLNGDHIDPRRWAPLVHDLHEALPEKPNRVIVLSRLPEMDWKQANTLRKQVVANGGLLETMDAKSFSASVERWLERVGNEVPVASAVPATMTAGARASWDAYKGSYVNDEEFWELDSEMRSESPSKKSSIS